MKSITNIQESVSKETEALQESVTKLTRCRVHIAGLEKQANALPDEIHELEEKVNDLIADGKSVTATEKKLNALRAELDRIESWLNSQSQGFTAKATQENRVCTNNLQQAVNKACNGVLSDLTLRADEAMKQLFEAHEEWHGVRLALGTARLPEPQGKFLLNCSNYVATLWKDREMTARYKKMLDGLPVDMAKAKYQVHDNQLAESKKATPTHDDKGREILHGNEKKGTPYVDPKPTDADMRRMIDEVLEESIKPMITKQIQQAVKS